MSSSPKSTPRGAARPQSKPTPPSKLRSTAAALRSDLANVSDQLTAAQQKLSGLEQQRLEAETPPHLRCPITLQRMCSPVMVADGHTFERRAIEQWLMQHDTNPLTGTALPPGARNASALYPSLALRDATRAWEMEHGRSPTPRTSPLRPSPGGQDSPLTGTALPAPGARNASARDATRAWEMEHGRSPTQRPSPLRLSPGGQDREFGEEEEEEEEGEGEEYGEVEYGEDEYQDQDQGENENTFEYTAEDLEAVRQSLGSVAVEALVQPRDATEDERLLNLGRDIARTRARFEERMASITPADRERWAARQAAITPAVNQVLAERERSLARYTARRADIIAEHQAASERYEQWQRQEVRQAAGAQWLSELAEQRESEQAAAAAEDERGSAAPYQRPPAARRSASSLLPGVAVTLHGLSGPRGEALNGRSSIWSKWCSTLARIQAGSGRPTRCADQRERVQRGPSPSCVLRKGCAAALCGGFPKASRCRHL